MGAGRRAEPRQRMLEEREQLHRREPLERCVCDETREHAGCGLAERIAAGIVRRDVPAFERDQDPPRQRAIRRHQGGGARRCIERFAQGDGDGERLLLDIGRLDHGDGVHRPRERAGRVRGGEALTPAIGRCGRSQRFAEQDLAAMRRRRHERDHVAARNADAREEAVHGELRMAGDGRRPSRVGTAADEVPRRIVEVGVEPRQHHGAAGKARDGREKARGGGHRAGRAGGDHRRARGGEAARFRRDQPVAPLRRLDRAAFSRESPASVAARPAGTSG